MRLISLGLVHHTGQTCAYVLCVCPPEPKDRVPGPGPAERRCRGPTEEVFLLQNGVRHRWSQGGHGPRPVLYERPHHHPDHPGGFMDEARPRPLTCTSRRQFIRAASVNVHCDVGWRSELYRLFLTGDCFVLALSK